MNISWDSPQTLKNKNASIMSISWDSPEPSGESGAPAETAANLVTPKPAHHEHQLGQPPLKHKNASIMSISWDSPEPSGASGAPAETAARIKSISWDSPEPSGASGAPAETAANLVTLKPAHHEHQLGQPGAFRSQEHQPRLPQTL